MKRFVLILIALGLSLTLMTACNSVIPPEPVVITDDLGRTVNFAETPQRIVSLAPSITEILFALDLDDIVVGVTDFCEYPIEAQDKPNVGSYFSTNLEVIIAQDPDVVLTDGHDPVADQLEELGVSMVVLQPQDIAGIFRNIELVGEITGQEMEAYELVADMEKRIDTVAVNTEGVEHPSVFYIIDATDSAKPWTVGAGSFTDTLITLAGGENIIRASQDYLQISLEEVVEADPEIIIGPSSHGTAFLPDFSSLPAWKEISAVKKGYIYLIEADLISRPGPRIVDGLDEMARIIHPELYQ